MISTKRLFALLVSSFPILSYLSGIAQPTVQNFSPRSTISGGEINIYGTGFSNVSKITFGGIGASAFQVMSSSWIKAYPSEEGKSGHVAVYTGAGLDSLSGFTFLSSPTFTSFSPASGGLGTEITIRGNNLNNTLFVNVGNATVPMIVRNDTMVVVKMTLAGFGNIAFGVSGKKVLSGFYFDYIGPIVNEITPTWIKKGTRVVIKGSAFGNIQQVRFGNLPGIDVVKTNDGHVEATVP